ncbi:MAG: Rieske 2Fe-2S domain-containing protein [Marmoricola sp.]
MWTERISETIENASVLDAPAGAATGLLNKLLPAGRLKDLLSGTALGHPAHPLLVTLPIGAWVSATVLDLVGGSRSRGAAQTLVAVGTLAAVPAAVTGASDWSDTLGAERRAGFVHALANYTALGLYTASWNARRHGRHGAGMRHALVGAGVLSFGGWLGGHLAYSLGVGVDTTAFLTGPTEWTDVAAGSDLVEGEPLGVTAGVVPVLLVRQHGELVALNDRCTHRGGPLHEGTLVDGCIQCPWHDSRFALTDGHVVRGPATRPQPRFEVRLQDDRVQVRAWDEQRTLRSNPVATGNE